MDSDAVERVRAALRASGHVDTIRAFPSGTRTAAEAAAAIGCAVAQIAKSIVFRAGQAPVLVIASGANRIDPARAAEALGTAIAKADPGWVRETTGFAVGGVAPVGHLTPPRVLIDRDLLAYDSVWAAAGSAAHVFRTAPVELVQLTGGAVADVRQDRPP